MSNSNLRNTPALLDEDFITECKANGVIKVTEQCFMQTINGLIKDQGEDLTPITVLEVLEDLNHAYVFDGQYFMAMKYTAQYAQI